VNKSELIDAVSKTTSLAKREADEAVNAFIHAVASEVKAGRRVVVAGFGSFNPTRRGARMGRNPQTGTPVAISASRGVRFAASAMLKEVLNGRSSLPQLNASGTPTRAVKAGKATKSSSRASAKAVKKSSKRPAVKKSSKRPAGKKAAQGSKKVVRRAPATKAAKRVRARKAAKQSARKAVRRAPAKTSAKRVRAKKAVKRSARPAVRRAS